MKWKKGMRFSAAVMLLACLLSLAACDKNTGADMVTGAVNDQDDHIENSYHTHVVAGFSPGGQLVVVDPDGEYPLLAAVECPVYNLDGSQGNLWTLHSGQIIEMQYDFVTDTTPAQVRPDRINVVGETQEDLMGVWSGIIGMLDDALEDHEQAGFLLLRGLNLRKGEQEAVRIICGKIPLNNTMRDYDLDMGSSIQLTSISVYESGDGEASFTGGSGNTAGDYEEFDAQLHYNESGWNYEINDYTQKYLYRGFGTAVGGAIELRVSNDDTRIIAQWDELIHMDGSPATVGELFDQAFLLVISRESWPAEPWSQVTARTVIVCDYSDK